MFVSSSRALLVLCSLSYPVLSMSSSQRRDTDAASSLRSAADVASRSFSYIVVGGGTAGLVVATRLSENPLNSVLVLEAGQARLNDPVILAPSQITAMMGNSTYDWIFKSVPQTNSANVVVPFNRGKVLGGSSAINALVWDRVSRQELDDLVELTNDRSWTFNSMLTYFKKPEKCILPSIAVESTTDIFWGSFTVPDKNLASQFHLTFDQSTRGNGGPVQTTFSNFYPGVEKTTIPGYASIGSTPVNDPMSGTNVGSWRATSAIDPVHRLRSYSANAYFQPNSRRFNLNVVTEAEVTRIIWSTSSYGGRTAKQVEFINQGQTYCVNVGSEVILSAGTIGSPRLLELSGVGDPNVLKAAGVQPVINVSGVGNNMMEHILVPLGYKVKPGVQTLDTIFANPNTAGQAVQNFSQTPATGPLGSTLTGISLRPLSALSNTSNQMLDAVAKVLAKQQRTPGQVKQQQLQLNSLRKDSNSISEVLVLPAHNTPDTVEANSSYVTFLVMLQHPFSRGSTHITSNQATTYPKIDPKYFSIDFDLDTLSHAVDNVASQLVTKQPWAGIIDKLVFPSPDAIDDDASRRNFIKQTISSQGHTTGTSSMMAQSDGGVVNNNFQVYGTTNVRVIDLSVMPQQFSGHPQALVYAIAEKGADAIKNHPVSNVASSADIEVQAGDATVDVSVTV